MKRTHTEEPLSPGFAEMMADYPRAKRLWELEKKTKHLPKDLEHGLPLYRDMIQKNHEATLAEDWSMVREMHDTAYLLALKLNQGDTGIFADEKSMGSVLQASTAAPVGTVPLWGQLGDFTLTIDGMAVRCVLPRGLVSRNGARWPEFDVHAVDRQKPFLSGTGFRSFSSLGWFPSPDNDGPVTVDVYVRTIIERYVTRDLKGSLLTIPKDKAQPRRKPATKREKK
jgi:hypothetical protein